MQNNFIHLENYDETSKLFFPLDFSNFNHLFHINLSRNRIQKGIIILPLSVVELNLSENRVQKLHSLLPNLHLLPNILFLDLSDNCLGDNFADFCENFSFPDSLVSLNLSDNSLESPSKMFLPSQLNHLNLSNNNFTSVTFI
jgi:hypothetical protein